MHLKYTVPPWLKLDEYPPHGVPASVLPRGGGSGRDTLT